MTDPLNIEQILADIAGDIDKHAREIEDAADTEEDVADPGPFGIAVATRDGEVFTAGTTERFPIQSISKALALDMALRRIEDRVFERVGREPSGDPFNSLIDLERTGGIPRNPFINAGALLVVDILVEQYGTEARDVIVDLVREQVTEGEVTLDEEVLTEGTDLNLAMLNFMAHHGNLRSSPDAVIESYIRQCAIEVDVSGLAQAGRFLMHTRRDAEDDRVDCRARQTRTVLALMTTCGHYDASGDFAVRVGLPAKSGVGGGILAIAPETASIAVFSPNLDQNGNPILGIRALEMLVQKTGWSVFGPPLSAA
ncbi:glutaminase A [Croceibacterium ferulae]|uniref:glutaminase A n=1 Tax=Croceibacterium ferulae TaxID=1854641 RepID=UPI000EB5B58A|nr:glutaminase A [Croceibacterium ferulae]